MIKQISSFAILLCALILTGSCALKWLQPVEHQLPEKDLPESFTISNIIQDPSDRWWESFGSTELNSLVETAFADNLDMAQAWSRLEQAQYQAQIAKADLYPHLAGDASASRTKTQRLVETKVSTETDTSGTGSSSTDGGSAGGEVKTKTEHVTERVKNYSLGLTVSYELDIWGRIQSGAKSANLNTAATEQDALATALTLSGQVVETWLDLKAAESELKLINEQIETSLQSLELLKVRQRKSLSSAIDVYQQEQQVASVKSIIPQIEERIAVLRHQMAYLLGRSSLGDFDFQEQNLPDMPPPPETGLPSDLLDRRPDIRAAWLRLKSGEWNVVEAKANRLPSIRLTASQKYSNDSTEDLFENWVQTLAANLTAPVFQGGRLKAEHKRVQALTDEQFINYRRTVLQAIRDVENALVQEQFKTEYLNSLQIEADISARTLEEAQRRYQKGLSDYLPVLTALVAKQRIDRTLIAVKGELLVNRVALCKALGGGWLNELTQTYFDKNEEN